jgi:ParB/RepB/Spo0J family partition protein
MAKRKRLMPAQGTYLEESAGLETKSALSARAPIAAVAGDAAATAALQEVSAALSEARTEGRLITPIPLDMVRGAYLTRDRVVVEDDDMAALIDSLRTRGQQTPIEVVKIEGGYGLISGWRRLQALRQLRSQTGEKRFDVIQALIRTPETLSDAYVAMVEENEIRVGLSYFERARIAAKAVEQGVFPDAKQALLSLFASASRAKRSKIRSYLPVVAALDGYLRFPAQLAERLGLQLSKALDADPNLSSRLQTLLTARPAESAQEEQTLLQSALVKPALQRDAVPQAQEVLPGLFLESKKSQKSLNLILSGPALTPDFEAKLKDWLCAQG